MTALLEHTYVWGAGSSPCPIMVVGEAPGVTECKMGEPFVGRTGVQLEHFLHRICGLSVNDVSRTNWCKRYIGNNKVLKAEEAEMMSAILRDEIAAVNPKYILVLGAMALKFFDADLRIDMANGVPMVWGERIVVPCVHPAAAFRDPALFQWVAEAFSVFDAVIRGTWEFPAGWGDSSLRVLPFADCLEECDGYVAIDTELLISGRLYMFQISTQSDNAAIVYRDDPQFDEYARVLNEVLKDNICLMHNAMFDWRILPVYGIVPHKVHDTMQIAALLQTLPLGLKQLAYRLLGIRLKEYTEVVYGGRTKTKEPRDLSMVDKEVREEYATGDPAATLRCYKAMRPMWYPGMEAVLDRDMGSMKVFMHMMDRGILLDADYLHRLRETKEKENQKLLQHITETYPVVSEVAPKSGKTKGIFNPGSDKQVAELVYRRLNLGAKLRVKPTKWGGSTNASHLAAMQNAHPVVADILKWRKVQALCDSFLSVLPKHRGSDGAVRTNFNLSTNKHSGRPASTKPNLLNIPVRTEEGRMIRDAFVARPGFVFLSCDYSQIELRVLAHVSKDPLMVNCYRNNDDIHTQTAVKCFGITAEEVDEMKHRYPSKRINFGIVNGLEDEGLARELRDAGAEGWTIEKCREFRQKWFDLYAGVRDYIAECQRIARMKRYGVDMWGRREYIPHFLAFPDSALSSAGGRIAINQQIQSGAAGIMKEAMCMLSEWVDYWVQEDIAYPLLQIYDDLMFEVRVEHLEEVAEVVRWCMENAADMEVPLVVEAKTGTRWGSLKKMKIRDTAQKAIV